MKEESRLPYGGAIFSFDNMEEFFAQQAANEAQANTNVVPPQREITWGSYVVRLVPDLVIWGSIPEWDDLVAKERSYYADPFDEGEEEEFTYTIEGLKDRLERGYVFGTWSSVIEPGELGDAHISTLWPIQRRDYEYARRLGWRMGNLVWNRIREGMAIYKEGLK